MTDRALSTLALLLLVAFGAFSVWVTATQGYTGFLGLAAREPWALQILLDLTIACLLYSMWLVRDARQHGINPWPYLLVTLFAGSLGGLAYLVRRGFASNQGRRAAAGRAG